MQLISAKTLLEGVPSRWRRRRLEIGAAGYLSRDVQDRVGVFVLQKPRFMAWFRAARTCYLGALAPDIQRSVLPLLEESKKIRVRVVDVPWPCDRGQPLQYHVSIWGEVDATKPFPDERSWPTLRPARRIHLNEPASG